MDEGSERPTAWDPEAVYREYGPRLWRALVLATGSRDVASDAVAEAFAQVLRRGSDVRDPAAWVWRAGFRIAAGEMKRRGHEVTGTVDRAVTEEPEEVLAVLEALARLTPHQRRAVVLADYAGYSHAEVGRIVGSTSAAVAVNAHRGRKRLRELLGEDHG